MKTFEEIRDRLAEQEYGDADEHIFRSFSVAGFKHAFDLLRPLLDGWKDVATELPESKRVCIIYKERKGLALSSFYEIGWMDLKSGFYGNTPDLWMYVPSLPGSYPSLQELINHKIK